MNNEQHDPLCPEKWRWEDSKCMSCDLIARVREDQHTHSIQGSKRIVAGLYIFGYDTVMESLGKLVR